MGSRELDNEPYSSVKFREFHDVFIVYQLLKRAIFMMN
jgi:hypothetical protein